MRMRNLAGLLLALVAASATAQQYPPTGRGFSGGDLDNPLGLPNGAFATPALYFTSDPDAGLLYFVSGPMIQNKTSTDPDGRTWTVWQNGNWAVTQWYSNPATTTSLIRMVDVGTDTPAFTVTATTAGGDNFDFDASTAGGEPSFNFALNDGGAGSVSVLNMIDTAATFATPVNFTNGTSAAKSITNGTADVGFRFGTNQVHGEADNVGASSTAGFFSLTTSNGIFGWSDSSQALTGIVADVNRLHLAVDDAYTFEITANGPDFPDNGSKPTCDSTLRGIVWVDEGGAGVADTAEMCLKNSADTYAWVALATP